MVKFVETVMKRKYEVVRATEAIIASVADDDWYSDMELGKWEIVSTCQGSETFYYGSYDTKKSAEEDARGLRRSERKGA